MGTSTCNHKDLNCWKSIQLSLSEIVSYLKLTAAYLRTSSLNATNCGFVLNGVGATKENTDFGTFLLLLYNKINYVKKKMCLKQINYKKIDLSPYYLPLLRIVKFNISCKFVFLTKFSDSGSNGKDGSLGSEKDHSSSFFAGAIMDVKPRQPTCILEQFCNTEIFTHYS